MTEKTNKLMRTFAKLLKNPVIYASMNPHHYSRRRSSIAPRGQLKVIQLLAEHD